MVAVVAVAAAAAAVVLIVVVVVEVTRFSVVFASLCAESVLTSLCAEESMVAACIDWCRCTLVVGAGAAGVHGAAQC